MKALITSVIQRYIVLIILILIISTMVVIVILKDRISQLVGVLNPWSEQKAIENMCHDKCSYWCRTHIGQPGTEWRDIVVVMPRGEIMCDEAMKEILGDDIGNCTCTGAAG